MKTKYIIASVITLALAVFVVAQVGGLGGSGGSLGIPTNPLVNGHHWKSCPLTSQEAFIEYNVRHNETEKTIHWKGTITFYEGNRQNVCVANLGSNRVDYSRTRLTAREALSDSINQTYLEEYNKKYVPNGFTEQGNYTR